MGKRAQTDPSSTRIGRKSTPPATRLARTAAYYKLFTTTMFVLLGAIIVFRSIAEGGALAPTLIGVCLIGLGAARGAAVYRSARRKDEKR